MKDDIVYLSSQMKAPARCDRKYLRWTRKGSYGNGIPKRDYWLVYNHGCPKDAVREIPVECAERLAALDAEHAALRARIAEEVKRAFILGERVKVPEK
jgi:hypothetical protein